ncbi:MAG: cation-translocating P-type ATPase, partial [Anaerolineales bacterium]|nr:cation-translocating P-type ATPase [Anaerolineales bacterium]
PILRAGLAGLLRGRPTTHTLVAIGAFAAFGVSAYNLLSGEGPVYFDTAAMLFFLIAIGRWLEIRAHKTSSEAVARLADEIPREARWLSAGGVQTVPLEDLPAGARVRILPGEHFPVDGIVALGEGEVDESLLTGEPTPALRRPGDQVLAGTINLDGAFEVITTAVGEASTAGQITRLLHQALWQRSPAERQADRLAAILIPLAILLAGITFAYWTFTQDAETGLLNALSVLLIACPCALGLATPLTLWRGLGRAAQAGVIVRSTAVMEHLGKIRRIFFDKTGTLTRLPMRLEKIGLPDGNVCEADEASSGRRGPGAAGRKFVARAASLEALSEHPFAESLRLWAESASIDLLPAEDFRAVPGAGVQGTIEGESVWVGSRRLMATSRLNLSSEINQLADRWQSQGTAVIFAGWGGQVRGILGFVETVKPEAAQAIADLNRMGIEAGVLTGDTRAAARRWSKILGIPVEGDLLPDEKLALLKMEGDPVAMVGDGINDGPALAAAPVGIAIHQGSDVARAAAEVVLMRDDLRSIPWLLGLGRETVRRVRQNLAWALLYNILGIALAMTGHLQPVLAALAMVVSSLIVTSNALRLGRYPGPDSEAERKADDNRATTYPTVLEEPT